jgi:hypothetical protein
VARESCRHRFETAQHGMVEVLGWEPRSCGEPAVAPNIRAWPRIIR